MVGPADSKYRSRHRSPLTGRARGSGSSAPICLRSIRSHPPALRRSNSPLLPTAVDLERPPLIPRNPNCCLTGFVACVEQGAAYRIEAHCRRLLPNAAAFVDDQLIAWPHITFDNFRVSTVVETELDGDL